MADPRLDVKFDDIKPQRATFKIDNSTITYSSTVANGSSQVGLAVTLSAAETVELVGDGEDVLGKLLSVTADNYCTVQVGGVMTLPGGTSATLTLGTKIVGDLLVAAEGYIRSANSAVAAELLVARGSIWDASDASNVVVKLDS